MIKEQWNFKYKGLVACFFPHGIFIFTQDKACLQIYIYIIVVKYVIFDLFPGIDI